MGQFEVEVQIANINGGDIASVSLIVDTGALHSVLSREFMDVLHIEAPYRRSVRFANDEIDFWDMGHALIRHEDREAICPLYCTDSGRQLLGATTLENLGYSADPVNGRLVPAEDLM